MIEIGDLPLYNQDFDSLPQQPEQYVRFRDQVRGADGVLFCTPEYNRGISGVLKNAIDVGSRPYGQSVWDQKPAAIISASIGAIGGFGANHQLRQSCVFLNMPVMQQPEAYLSNISDDDFDADGRLKDGRTKEFVESIAHAFHDWVDMIHRSRALLAEDAAHEKVAEQQAEPA
jgi:chromate reductase